MHDEAERLAAADQGSSRIYASVSTCLVSEYSVLSHSVCMAAAIKLCWELSMLGRTGLRLSDRLPNASFALEPEYVETLTTLLASG